MAQHVLVISTRRVSPWERAAVALLILLAFGLRAYHLDTQSLWHDEGLSWWYASRPLAETVRDVAHTDHPPFYFLTLGLWLRLAGESAFALRFFSVIPGTLAVAATLNLVRYLRLPRSGILAAIILALHPTHIWYSQEVRSYAWTILIGLVLTFLAWAWWCTARTRHGLAYALTAAIALYIHLFMAFLLLAHAVTLVLWSWKHRLERRVSLQRLLPYLVAGLAFLPWLSPTLAQLHTNHTYWFNSRLDLPRVLGQTARAFTLHEAVTSPWNLGMVALLWGLAAWGTPRLMRSTAGQLVVVSAWLPPLLTLAVAHFIPKYTPRYVLYSLPFWLLLVTQACAAVGRGTQHVGVKNGREDTLRAPRASAPQAVTRVPVPPPPLSRYLLSPARNRPRALVVLSLMAVYALMARETWAALERPPLARPDFRGALTYLRQNASPGDALILVGGHSEAVVRYYLRRQDVTLYPMPSGLMVDLAQPLTREDVVPALTRISRTHSRAWLLLWQEDHADPRRLVYTHLLAHVPRLPVYGEFPGVALLLFRFDRPLILESLPQPRHQVRARFANGLVLVGYDVARGQSPVSLAQQRLQGERGDEREDGMRVNAGDTLFLTMYWQVERPLPEDLTGFVHLVSRDGQRAYGLMDRRLGGDLYPTSRWPVGEVVRQDFPLPVGPQTPPGEYLLEVGVYRPANLQRIPPQSAAGPGVWVDGDRLLVGPVRVLAEDAPP